MSQRLPVSRKADYIRLPLVKTSNVIVFPHVVTPMYLSKDNDYSVSDSSNQKIFVANMKDSNGDLIGTVCQVLRRRNINNNRIKIILQGLETAKIIQQHEDHGSAFVDVTRILEKQKENSQKNVVDNPVVKSIIKSLLSLKKLGMILSKDLEESLEKKFLSNDFDQLVTSHLKLSLKEKKSLFSLKSSEKRLHKINDYLCRELEVQKENRRLFCQTKIVLDSLNTPSPNIKKEVSISKKAEVNFLKSLPLDKSAIQVLLQQYAKLSALSIDSGEYSSLLSYFEQIRRVPWNKTSPQADDFQKVERILSKKHYGMNDVKERVLEHLSLRKLSQKNKGVVLCLVGPPGVGKTSIGEAIAVALGKSFVRISLGGIKEEADIRGHRRTYVGSYPGRIISALQSAGSCNPVVMLDEIDKMPDNSKSGAIGALLEVLDPQQNKNFVDHYLNVPFDLSNIMFIANANSIDNLNPQLKDRLEIIQVHGYTEDEKVKIARKCLMPKILKDSGLDHIAFSFEKDLLKHLIRSYTKESGVRSLERVLRKIVRKFVRTFVQNDCKPIKRYSLTRKRLEKFLGNPLWKERSFYSPSEHGVSLALAYSQQGGSVLVVEAKVHQGLGLTLTGNMGSVMKESILAGIGFLKSNSDLLGLSVNAFGNKEVHIHMPEGACYKEGPSAGLPILCSLVSALLKQPIFPKLAMTGEITLGGKVLGVGGLKEKILAASREGMEDIILPSCNLSDYKALSQELQSSLRVHFVDQVAQALAIVFPKLAKGGKIDSK